jgi:hypothetical protein
MMSFEWPHHPSTAHVYHKLIYFDEVDKGGHFAAWEHLGFFATEMLAAFKSLS